MLIQTLPSCGATVVSSEDNVAVLVLTWGNMLHLEHKSLGLALLISFLDGATDNRGDLESLKE